MACFSSREMYDREIPSFFATSRWVIGAQPYSPYRCTRISVSRGVRNCCKYWYSCFDCISVSTISGRSVPSSMMSISVSWLPSPSVSIGSPI